MGFNIFDAGEPLAKFKNKKFGGKEYDAASVENTEGMARQSAKDWRKNGYEARVFKKRGFGYIVYIK